MKFTAFLKKYISRLKKEFNTLKIGRESLIIMIDETEIPENIFNSNAIENSTLTLKETERIILEMETSREISLREVYEAKNLARVIDYIRNKCKQTSLNKDLILFLHQMLISGINDKISGRFRNEYEYVRVGPHIAPAPQQVESMIDSLLLDYSTNLSDYFLSKIARFHLEFEHIHLFCDGNGRIGRILVNFLLQQLDFPAIIFRNKEKQLYYKAFNLYNNTKKINIMEKILYLALAESLHKRITYLKGHLIIKLSDYSKMNNLSITSMLNKAKRQTIPAFRERGIWKIGKEFVAEVKE